MVLGLLWLLGALTSGTAVATQEKSPPSVESKPVADANDAILKYFAPKQDSSVGSEGNNEAALEEWKRAAHRLMHFGKRLQDEDQTSLEADSNEEKRGSHRMMHFGKRQPGPVHVGEKGPSVFREANGPSKADDSDFEKRASHRLMHFGKREQDDDKRAGHKMMHFGKREEEDKRAGHKMMHFGKRDEEHDGLDTKRAGHKMMHFGKRNEGEDEEEDNEEDEDVVEDAEKRGHKMMHFGKRDEEAQEFAYQDDYKRAGHKMMHFGKRDEDEKRAGHKMMHFGKKADPSEQGQQDVSGSLPSVPLPRPPPSSPSPSAPRRTTRSVTPFFYDPYRSRDLLDLIQRLYREDAKRGHNIMRFGKRRSEGPYYYGRDSYPESGRSGSQQHSLLHFGKRLDPEFLDIPDEYQGEEQEQGFNGFEDDYEDEQELRDNIEIYKNLAANYLMDSEKRGDPWMSDREIRQRLDDYKRGHSLLHFGKRYGYGDIYEKRPQHTIMHFGKRSADFPVERNRLKRSTSGGPSDLRALLWRPAVETGYLLPHALSAAEVGTLHVPMFVGQLNRIQRAAYPYYNLPKAEKKEHRNIYLHFG